MRVLVEGGNEKRRRSRFRLQIARLSLFVLFSTTFMSYSGYPHFRFRQLLGGADFAVIKQTLNDTVKKKRSESERESFHPFNVRI